MTVTEDKEYISNYLIHWTGIDDNGNIDDARGAEILSVIASTCELLLSYNRIHIFDWYQEIQEKMVCFTDVPLAHSEEHCVRYGRFAIAFHKLRLMNVGAQPVFYATHVYKKDLDVIFRFLQEQLTTRTLDENVFRALHRHFYYMQRFSDERADRTDTYYYEREWRLGSMTLATPEELDRANPRFRCQQEGYLPYIGKRVIHDGREYFGFSAEDVAFLITPTDWSSKINNPHGFPVRNMEGIIKSPKKIP